MGGFLALLLFKEKNCGIWTVCFTSCSISRRYNHALATIEASCYGTTALQRLVRMSKHSIGTGFTCDRRKAKVLRREFIAFLEWASIEHAQNLPSNAVGNIGNELESIKKGANYEAIIATRDNV